MVENPLRATSRWVLSLSAGVVASGLALEPARAADLPDSCCRDLKQRVAELGPGNQIPGGLQDIWFIQAGARILF